MKKLAVILGAMLLSAVCGVNSYASQTTVNRIPDYKQSSNWVYLESGLQKPVDVFLLAPVVVTGKQALNININDEKTRANFKAALEMQKGIYNQDARVFAPYYRQVSLPAYYEAHNEKYFKTAYKDVKKSFKYYMKHYNQGRPLILAGFSHGSQNALKLMKDYMPKKSFQKQLIACYAIGWRLTEAEVKANPALKPAQGASDNGVIITFNTEAPEIEDSLMIPKGIKTYAINPLNWSTDNALVDKSLNKGACFPNGKGEITKELPQLTGAYIDTKRGALKLPDLEVKDYPAVIFSEGIYHIYDYQFFYRNLQENVAHRICRYFKQNNM